MTKLELKLNENFQGLKTDWVSAVSTNGQTYPASELILLAKACSHKVQAVSPNAKRVGIYLNHTVEAYVAVLMAFMSKITFVPLNPSFPSERLRTMCEKSQIDVILCGATNKPVFTSVPQVTVSLDATSTSENDEVGSDSFSLNSTTRESDDIAYILFTSGSTGEPKGVPISYSNLSHYVTSICDLIEFTQGGRYSQLFDLSFDLSMHDIFVAWFNRGAVCAPNAGDLLFPRGYLERNDITDWFSVPMLGKVLSTCYSKSGDTGKLNTMLFCGEALPVDYVRELKSKIKVSIASWNLYGPTEATIAFSGEPLEGLDLETLDRPSVSIGNPFGQNRAAILEAETNKILKRGDWKEGLSGELLLGGPQIFSGYLDSANANPFLESGGLRYYKSGDLVEFSGSSVWHLGRVDGQIKLRGYRVEVEEIESRLRTHLSSGLAAVAVGKFKGADWLCAFHVGEIPPISQLIERLHIQLPEYMIPKFYFQLEALPLNVNGKLDRKELARLATEKLIEK